jgi:hypothetical protein
VRCSLCCRFPAGGNGFANEALALLRGDRPRVGRTFAEDRRGRSVSGVNKNLAAAMKEKFDTIAGTNAQ